MRILFDQGTPAPLRHALPGHVVTTVAEVGWDRLRNGELLRAAEGVHDLLLTTDQSIRHQQNVTGRSIAIVVLLTTDWRIIRSNTAAVVTVIDAIQPGQYREVDFPRPQRRGRA